MAASSIVLVSLTGDEQVRLYDLDRASGALQLRATGDAHGPSGALCLHPSRTVLLTAHVESTTLASLRLDATSGELTLINMVDTGIGTPAHLITDRAGRFLLTAYYGGGGVTVHRLRRTTAPLANSCSTSIRAKRPTPFSWQPKIASLSCRTSVRPTRPASFASRASPACLRRMIPASCRRPTTRPVPGISVSGRKGMWHISSTNRATR